jgi:hypothetical protein
LANLPRLQKELIALAIHRDRISQDAYPALLRR